MPDRKFGFTRATRRPFEGEIVDSERIYAIEFPEQGGKRCQMIQNGEYRDRGKDNPEGDTQSLPFVICLLLSLLLLGFYFAIWGIVGLHELLTRLSIACDPTCPTCP